MNRRAFVTGLGAALAAPLAAEAQRQAKAPRIGVLWLASRDVVQHFISAYERALGELGYVAGQSVVIEYRFADGNAERLPILALELVKLNIDLIAVGPNPMIEAARRATNKIPIVMAYGVDPVGQGYIASLARPGGNVTGVAWDPTPDIAGKYVELLGKLLPPASRIAVLWDPEFSPGANRGYLNAADATARDRGFTLEPVQLSLTSDLSVVAAALKDKRAAGMIVLQGPQLFTQKAHIIELAARQRIPTFFMWREGPESGGRGSYGPNLVALWRRAALYTEKILKGAKPADLPVEQPTQFELVINLKTAKALGLTIPPSLLLRADQVIE
jgi:putative tryptophan/tyrosine transport system substrate-binding protein